MDGDHVLEDLRGHFDEVLATLEDGKRVELFSYYPQERSFTPDDFVGLTVDEGRRLKFAPSHARPARS